MTVAASRSPSDEIPGAVRQRPLSLRLNFSWTMIGNVVYAASQWGILALLAKLGSPHVVGEFSLGAAITAPVLLFSGLQLRAIQATDARHSFRFADYAGLRVLTTVAAVLSIVVVSCIGRAGQETYTVIAFAFAKGIDSFSDVIYGLWQQQERMDLIAWSLILRGVLSLSATAICFVTFGSVWASVCGMGVAWLTVFCTFDVKHGYLAARTVGQSIHPRVSVLSLRQLIGISLPLGIVTMLTSFNGNVPRYIITELRGVADLGVFSALGYVLLAGGVIVNALGQSTIPRLAVYSAQGRLQDFWRLVHRLLLIGLILGLAGFVACLCWGPRLMTILYGREYAGNQPLLLWLTVAAGVNYMASFAGCSLTAARHFRVQVPLFIFTTLVTAAACYVLVGMHGLTGAAQAMTVSGFVQFVSIIAFLRHKTPPSHA